MVGVAFGGEIDGGSTADHSWASRDAAQPDIDGEDVGGCVGIPRHQVRGLRAEHRDRGVARDRHRFEQPIRPELGERTVPLFTEALGTLRSKRQVAIAARLAAEVRRVAVRPGAAVAAGELLVELEGTALEAQVNAVAAKLAVAEQGLAEARREAERTRTLFEREARTQQELDTAATRLAAAEAEQQAAAGGLAAARAALDDTRLVAPFAGVVLARAVDPGDLAPPGRTLLELYDPNALQLELALPERLLSGVSVGDELAVRFDALQGPGGAPLEVAARVDELVPAVDPATRTALIKLELPAVAGALPGMFARARVPEAERLALSVPLAAVVRRGQLELVFTASADGRFAHMHLVRTGRVRTGPSQPDEVELLAGLSGEQRVIVAGAQTLRDGAPIRIEGP